jgi:hypothetical protein
VTRPPLKVLFIAGSGRSGTTILHNVLGQLDGFFAAGELRELWLRGAVNDRLCGCGTSFWACPTWRAIVDHAFGSLEDDTARETAALIEGFRIHQLPRTWVPWLRRDDLARRAALLDRLRRLYLAIGEVTGCRVIVDSSKNPSYGYLLGHAGVGELDVLHVVRDARATAYSWGQRKAFEPGHMMRRRSAAVAAIEWNAHNLATELFLVPLAARHLRLRYEDAVIEPRRAVGDILAWLGEEVQELPFTSERDVRLDRVVHAVFGNAVRFQNGEVRLLPDERWRTSMDRRDALTVAALTAPLRVRYGYGRRSRPDRVAA